MKTRSQATDALERLLALLKDAPLLALAFSGGLDSRFLAHAAQRLAGLEGRMHLFHITGPHVPRVESDSARAWARERDLPLSLVSLDPLTTDGVRENGRERCYHCKHALFSALRDAVSGHSFFAGQKFLLCDGSNASDLEVYRPGLRALQELGVRSPLAEAGLRKEQLRLLGAETDLDRPDQQARPCLLTRFAYGLRPDRQSLLALDAAERQVEALLSSHAAPGTVLPDFRLRLTGANADADPASPLQSYAVELHLDFAPAEDLCVQLVDAIAAQGFSQPTIVSAASVSGHFDRQSSA